MTKSGHRIRHKRVDEKTGREVDYDAIVKGFERTKGKMVLLDSDELNAAAPKQTRTIEIEDFVDLEDIDPIYYNSTYYVAPRSGEGADKAYVLLRESMEKSGRAAIGRFVMRSKQYLVVIRPTERMLVLETLYFADEVRNPKELDIPTRVKVNPNELKIARQLIDSLTREWDPKHYKDTYRAEVQKVIARVANGEEVTVAEPKEEGGEVLDLVEALKASLDKKPKARARKRRAS
jgi:DNA end-binding protein Ku